MSKSYKVENALELAKILNLFIWSGDKTAYVDPARIVLSKDKKHFRVSFNISRGWRHDKIAVEKVRKHFPFGGGVWNELENNRQETNREKREWRANKKIELEIEKQTDEKKCSLNENFYDDAPF
jgi:hypothetical protein